MRLQWVLLLVLGSFAAGCSFVIPSLADETRPESFRITYVWREGSLPPPYHYEYTITLEPTGEGEIVMIPDYAMNEPPTWTEHFRLSDEEMDALFRELVADGLLSRRWQAVDDPPVGGSSQSLTVVVRGQEIEVPSYVPTAQEEAAAAIFAAVEAIVPQAIWDRLTAQREQYMEEHSD